MGLDESGEDQPGSAAATITTTTTTTTARPDWVVVVDSS